MSVCFHGYSRVWSLSQDLSLHRVSDGEEILCTLIFSFWVPVGIHSTLVSNLFLTTVLNVSLLLDPVFYMRLFSGFIIRLECVVGIFLF